MVGFSHINLPNSFRGAWALGADSGAKVVIPATDTAPETSLKIYSSL